MNGDFKPGDVLRAEGSGGIRVMVLVERELPSFDTWTAWFVRVTERGSTAFKAGRVSTAELTEQWTLL